MTRRPNPPALFPQREGGAGSTSLPLSGEWPGERFIPPTVSVVMAAKNYGRFLAESVESVRAQTFADWELVIIDDGSTDDTARIARGFLHDPRIRYVQSDRLGQTRAKNLGVDLARGAFVAFLDADDAWLPEKLEKQMKLFAPEIGVVFARRSLMDETGRPLAATTPSSPVRGRVLSDMFTQNFVCFSTSVVRREVLARVGRFNPQWDLAIDYDFWLRVAKQYEFDFVDEELVRYRTGHGNLSKKLLDRVEIVFAIMHRAGRDVPKCVRDEGYASTSRTIGHVMRASEPVTSLKWYWQALRHPHQRLHSVKGMLGSLVALLRGRCTPGAAENAAVNR